MDQHDTQDRAIGSLDARLTLMEGRVTRIEVSIAQRLDRLETAIDEVHEVVTSARGAWRAIAWILGISGSVAAAVGAAIHWLSQPL